jgi:hypothetical protein
MTVESRAWSRAVGRRQGFHVAWFPPPILVTSNSCRGAPPCPDDWPMPFGGRATARADPKRAYADRAPEEASSRAGGAGA